MPSLYQGWLLFWEIAGCSPSASTPGSLYLLLGQQHLSGEELQALTGKVVAQLLQAIHPQGLGGRGE